jgi:hypothetical protein
MPTCFGELIFAFPGVQVHDDLPSPKSWVSRSTDFSRPGTAALDWIKKVPGPIAPVSRS